MTFFLALKLKNKGMLISLACWQVNYKREKLCLKRPLSYRFGDFFLESFVTKKCHVVSLKKICRIKSGEIIVKRN